MYILRMLQGLRKESNFGRTHILLDPRSDENIEEAQVIVNQNIGGAHVPVPPCSYTPVPTHKTAWDNSGEMVKL